MSTGLRFATGFVDLILRTSQYDSELRRVRADLARFPDRITTNLVVNTASVGTALSRVNALRSAAMTPVSMRVGADVAGAQAAIDRVMGRTRPVTPLWGPPRGAPGAGAAGTAEAAATAAVPQPPPVRITADIGPLIASVAQARELLAGLAAAGKLGVTVDRSPAVAALNLLMQRMEAARADATLPIPVRADVSQAMTAIDRLMGLLRRARAEAAPPVGITAAVVGAPRATQGGTGPAPAAASVEMPVIAASPPVPIRGDAAPLLGAVAEAGAAIDALRVIPPVPIRADISQPLGALDWLAERIRAVRDDAVIPIGTTGGGASTATGSASTTIKADGAAVDKEIVRVRASLDKLAKGVTIVLDADRTRATANLNLFLQHVAAVRLAAKPPIVLTARVAVQKGFASQIAGLKSYMDAMKDPVIIPIRADTRPFMRSAFQVQKVLNELAKGVTVDLDVNRTRATANLNLFMQQMRAAQAMGRTPIGLNVPRPAGGGLGAAAGGGMFGGGGMPGGAFGSGFVQSASMAAGMPMYGSPAMMAGELAGRTLVGGTKAAIETFADLESQLTDIQRIAGLTAAELARFKASILGLSTSMPGVSTRDLMQIGQVGAQAGVGDKEGVGGLERFTKDITRVKLAVSDVPTEQLAEGTLHVLNVFKKGTEDVAGFGSALVNMANVSLASSKDILDISTQLSGTAASIKMTIPQVLALSSVLKDVGLENEVAGSAMSQIFRRMGSDSATFAAQVGIDAKTFADAYKRDPMEALGLVIAKFKDMKDTISGQEFLDELGLKGVRTAGALQQLAARFDDVKGRTAAAGGEMQSQESLDVAVNLKTENLKSQMDLAKNAATELGEAIGGAFKAPAVASAQFFADVASGLAGLTKDATTFWGEFLKTGKVPAGAGGPAAPEAPKPVPPALPPARVGPEPKDVFDAETARAKAKAEYDASLYDPTSRTYIATDLADKAAKAKVKADDTKALAAGGTLPQAEADKAANELADIILAQQAAGRRLLTAQTALAQAEADLAKQRALQAKAAPMPKADMLAAQEAQQRARAALDAARANRVAFDPKNPVVKDKPDPEVAKADENAFKAAMAASNARIAAKERAAKRPPAPPGEERAPDPWVVKLEAEAKKAADEARKVRIKRAPGADKAEFNPRMAPWDAAAAAKAAADAKNVKGADPAAEAAPLAARKAADDLVAKAAEALAKADADLAKVRAKAAEDEAAREKAAHPNALPGAFNVGGMAAGLDRQFEVMSKMFMKQGGGGIFDVLSRLKAASTGSLEKPAMHYASGLSGADVGKNIQDAIMNTDKSKDAEAARKTADNTANTVTALREVGVEIGKWGKGLVAVLTK